MSLAKLKKIKKRLIIDYRSAISLLAGLASTTIRMSNSDFVGWIPWSRSGPKYV
jgi:hypothetical protein